MKISNTAELLAQYMLDYKYNYSFLKSTHDKVKMCKPETMVTGSSHALYGIMESAFDSECANLSMHSQDIYYDMVNARRAVQSADGSIKTCIIVFGYYIIGQDLSKSINWGHRLIREIYYPLFQDAYHWENPESEDAWEIFKPDLKEPDTVKQEAEAILNQILWKGYFNDYKKRKSGVFDWGNGRTWKDLTIQERELAARQRTASHNKFIKRSATIAENRELLAQFIRFLHENHIRPIVAVTAFTKEYMKHTDAEYPALIADMVTHAAREAACPVDFYDMNQYDGLWTESDFIDTDHMSEEGAEKASLFLNQRIR